MKRKAEAEAEYDVGAQTGYIVPRPSASESENEERPGQTIDSATQVAAAGKELLTKWDGSRDPNVNFAMSGQAGEFATSDEDSRESLYSILNIPISASQDDIRHRYKELAVIFHPDRQSQKDENTKRVAEERFRQIQRAYEILMDPDQRQIYDTFGEAGLVARRAVGQRYSSPEELRAELERLVAEARGTSRTWKPIISLGEFMVGFDVAELFAPGHERRWKGPFSRLSGVKQTLLRVQHTMGLNFKNGTEASLTGRLQAVPYPGAPRDYGNILGTIRHQYSPRIQIAATANLLRSHALSLITTYNGDENRVSLKTQISPKFSLLLPPLTLELQRQLFVKSLTQGHLIFATGPQPSFTASLASPSHPTAAFAWSTGFQLSRYPQLSAELATKRLSGGFRAKLGIELGLLGLSGTIHGIWTGPEDSLVSVAVGATPGAAVYTRLTLELLGQRIFIPIVLSHEVDVIIGLCAVLVPSTLAALAHSFLIKPRLRSRRIFQLEATRHAHRTTIQKCREEAEQTLIILSEHAQRRAEHERAIGGLVILSATYTASGEDGESPISIDVTVALQAQVHNSQLLIPGGRSKVALLGFYDPSPGARKHLRIEYMFHGALHVADVGDFSQLVLPLRAHLAE